MTKFEKLSLLTGAMEISFRKLWVSLKKGNINSSYSYAASLAKLAREAYPELR